MDNNLPPNNDNQQSDSLNINLPEPPVTPPTETEKTSIPEMPEVPETPTTPTENIVTPEPEIKPEEQPIEIGSLGGQPSFTSYNQEIMTDSSSKSNKSKKIKTISSVLGILLIIAALPLSMFLVKQRQELRKEAATSGQESSGTANVCGVVLSATHSKNGNKFTSTFNLKNTRSDSAPFEFHTYSCACSDRITLPSQGGGCGTGSCSCTSTNDSITLAPGGSTSRQVTAEESAGDCGSFQNDAFIISVNGVANCSNN